MKKLFLMKILEMLLGRTRHAYHPRRHDDIFVYSKHGRELHRYSRRGSKLIKFALVSGLALFLLVGGLAIWGTVAVVNHAGNWLESSPVAAHLAQGESRVNEVLAQPLDKTLADGEAKVRAIVTQPITNQACLGSIGNLRFFSLDGGMR